MHFFRLGCLITLVAASAGAASAQVLQFNVDAQYRGVVKKSFNSIGSTSLRVTPGANGTFHVAGAGKVTHPQNKSKVYEFNLDMDFQLRGDRVAYVKSHNSCRTGSEDLEGEVAKLLPFVHLVTTLASGASRTITTPHGTYTLRQAETPKYTEVTIDEGGSLAGKFFLTRDTGQLTLEKFRIPTGDNVVLNFVSHGD